MKTIVLLIHTIVAVALIGLILLQSSKGGLGSAFGGGEFYRSKRGAERVVFLATVVATVLFLVTSIANFVVR
jgi:preprotein translocase subunit SecG